MKYILAIDVQNDFITGSLHTPEAIDAFMKIVKYLAEEIQSFENHCVIFTQDTHNFEEYKDTIEAKNVPHHCIKNEWGWKIPVALRDLFNGNPYVIEKDTFGSFQLPVHMKDVFLFDPIEDEIEIFGFCTDICVISNALILRAAFPETKITLLANLCSGTSPINHVNAIEVMKANQIEVKYC